MKCPTRCESGSLRDLISVISAAQQMLVLNQATGRVLRGKTGYADSNGEHFGWLVGYPESSEQRRLSVVTLIDMSDVSLVSGLFQAIRIK